MSEADPEGKTLSAPMLPVAAESSNTLDIAPTLLANRYELLGMLGAGAMGTVYRARDRELDEIVALKVLKKEIANADMLDRFRREVKLARRVTHRNVARTFDIGEDGGDRFLTMEFVEGEMLAALLARRGRLPLNDVVRIAKDICAGLSAAHAVGVIHRDLKPENVIVAKDGRAVITDFGIARAAQGEATRTVGIVGTPAYMAPEQVEGAADLDARADLYALGAMLFELVSGQQAWNGDTIIAIAAARLIHPPPDVRTVLPSLAPPMADLLLRLMARRREDRPATADDVASALDLLSTPSLVPKQPPISATLPIGALAAITPKTRPGTRVIAVLPIINLGPSDDEYLVDSVHEDLVDLLSVVPGLAVRPRGDTMRFTDKGRDAREIGRSANADVVVDASFRRIGNQVRAAFRLIAVADGFQLWAQRFDRKPEEVLTIADDAGAAIAKALTAEVAEKNAPRAHDPETEELYLRGRYLLRRGWADYMVEATKLFERAHARAPDDVRISGMYALAIARTYGLPPRGREVAEQARQIAEQTLAREPKQADAKVAIAILHLQDQEVDGAVRAFRQALAINPNGVEALDWIGRIMGEVGRVEDAITYLRRAASIDPENVAPRFQIARLRSMFGDVPGMLAELGPNLPTHPGDVALWFILRARDTLWRRNVTEATALKELARATPQLPESARFGIDAMLGVVLGQSIELQKPDSLDRILPVDQSRTPRRASFNAQIRAEVAGASPGNNVVATLDALRHADSNQLVDLVWLDRCSLFDPIRTLPEFVAIREHVAIRARRAIETLDLRSPTMA